MNDDTEGRSGQRICPDCNRKIVVTSRVMERCGDMDVLCPDCGCAFEPIEWQQDTETEQ